MILNAPFLDYSTSTLTLENTVYNLYACIQQLALQQQQLVQQLQSTRELLESALQGHCHCPEEQKGGEERLHSEENRKIFKKNRLCPADGCGRLYSSRISLRAHIRKCHGEEMLWEEKMGSKAK